MKTPQAQIKKVFLLLFVHKKKGLICFPLALFALAPAPAGAQQRVAVPITQTLLPDGDIRYSVPVRIGDSPPVQALLDTGSTGMRILPGTAMAGSYNDTGLASLYAFGSGERLSGTIGMAALSIGNEASEKSVPIELVSQVGCMDFAPDCGASKLTLDHYGIGGDGIADQGFRAILGVSLTPAANAGYTENPLRAVGAASWIIDLPEPGDPAPGILILNPSDVERQGYQTFPLQAANGSNASGWRDALPACLLNISTNQRICGPALLDTGTPGVLAYAAGASKQALWSPGDQAMLQFSTGGAGNLNLPFAVDKFPGSGLVQAPPNGGLALVAGVLPFYAYSVLYDPEDGLIGLKPRVTAPDLQNAAAIMANPQTQIEVIQMNAPGPAASNAPTATSPSGGMKLPQVITPTE